MMIPVFSLMTWLSLMMPEDGLVFNTIRDMYEAYVLYLFMQLLTCYLGGENQLIVHLEFKRRIRQPWPLDGMRPLQTDKLFYMRVKQGVLQFVIIKPITAILAIVLEKYGVYGEGVIDWTKGYVYVAFVNNVSITLSLYCLILFYLATDEPLKPYQPFSKFICIKTILFFSFWQACAFTIFIYMGVLDYKKANIIQNLLVSVEIVAAAVAQSFAFTYKGYLVLDSTK